MRPLAIWKCPKCGARAGKHGRGICNDHGPGCTGFVCECDLIGDYPNKSDAKDHGTAANLCENANCYHCGWGGVFPPPKFDPAKLRGWAKQAWAAGWRPPEGWTP